MKWISVDDRLPKQGVPVIVYSGILVQTDTFYIDQYEGGLFWDREGLDAGVEVCSGQYWMPLPDPPKES